MSKKYSDYDSLKAYMVCFNEPTPKSSVMEKCPDTLLDWLLHQEFDQLKSEGFVKFHNETGYTGIMFFPEQEPRARQLILDMIQSHAEDMNEAHERKVKTFRDIYKWFMKGNR
jgi:hypothetical protein